MTPGEKLVVPPAVGRWMDGMPVSVSYTTYTLRCIKSLGACVSFLFISRFRDVSVLSC